jgi:plastocyanin
VPRKLGAFLVCCAAIALPSSALALAADDADPASSGEPGGAPQSSVAASGEAAVVAPTAAPAQPPAAAQPVAPQQAAPAPAPATGEPAPGDEAAAPTAEQPARSEARRPRTEARRRARRKRRTARAAADGSVRIVNFKFSPKTISVNVGDRVTWTNSDSAPHTATDSGNFDTGTLNRGESGSATFDEAGTFSYICTIHPSMEGTVRVAGSSGGGSGGSSGSGSSGSGDGGSGSSAGDSSGSGGDGSTDDGADGGSLAATGGHLQLIALVGAAMLGAGILLRRRLTAGA